MERIFQFADDEAREELLLHCRTLASLSLAATPRIGPFNAPCGAIVGQDMQVEGWSSANRHDGLTYEELIETVRLEAMARSSAGQIEGAALSIYLQSPDGGEAVGIQIHTRRSSVAYLYRVTPGGRSLEEPEEVSLFLPEGLCIFAHLQAD
jgi:hypothetical protein